METREIMTSVKDTLECSTLSKNLKIAQIFELCLEPKTKEDLDNILLNFRERIKDIRLNEFFGIVDYVGMYVLDYVYKHDTVSFCSVSRTLYLYQMLDQLVLKGENRHLICSCDKGCLLKTLREFTDVYTYSKSEEMLVDVGLSAILAGNLGLALYLVKFGLIEFPSEVNEKCRKMFEILVSMFNRCSTPFTANVQVDDMETSIELNELLNQVKDKEINIKRSILTFCILAIVAEYQMYEKLEAYMVNLKFYTQHKKQLCLRKMVCINLYIQATMELNLTFKDIEDFTEAFLNQFFTAEIGKSFLETSRKLLDFSHNYYNPRSLKDVARFKVRSMLQKSRSIPEQVNELNIPIPLKEFLNFHGKGIWELLVTNHLNLSLEQQLSNRTPEIEDRNMPELEDGNMRELESGNVRELEDQNMNELGDGIARGSEDGNFQEVEDGNLHEREGEKQKIATEDCLFPVKGANVFKIEY